ncbi:MAG TPA: hypothetical protein VJ813_07845 [Vicinamibacterales bacterium]|nr:hypothetical protein [Vicinamibacterales bacterium]
MIRVLAICSLFLLGAVRPAAAEWHLIPMVGVTVLGSTTIADPELGTDKRHWNLGGAVTLLGPTIFGAEVITTWTPGFFERDDLDVVLGSRTVSAMANVVLTTPRRWTEYSLRPFVSGGLGLMHVAKDDQLLPVNLNLAGFNIGGGAVGFLTPRTGLRFDLRYHSTLRATEETSSFGKVQVRYVTASVGVVFRR